MQPTISPTVDPTQSPSLRPTFDPTPYPTLSPSDNPSLEPVLNPSTSPTPLVDGQRAELSAESTHSHLALYVVIILMLFFIVLFLSVNHYRKHIRSKDDKHERSAVELGHQDRGLDGLRSASGVDKEGCVIEEDDEELYRVEGDSTVTRD